MGVSNTEFEIAQPLDKVWDAFIEILQREKRGSIKNESRYINRIEFKSKLFLKGFASVTISLKKKSAKKTVVQMSGYAINDNQMGFAQEFIDKFSFALSEYFEPKKKK